MIWKNYHFSYCDLYVASINAKLLLLLSIWSTDPIAWQLKSYFKYLQCWVLSATINSAHKHWEISEKNNWRLFPIITEFSYIHYNWIANRLICNCHWNAIKTNALHLVCCVRKQHTVAIIGHYSAEIVLFIKLHNSQPTTTIDRKGFSRWMKDSFPS